MIKFLCLGSGSSGNSYLLCTETTSILIDAGLSIRGLKKQLKPYGFALEKIDAVFVTHDHADHIKAVGHLAEDMDKKIYATPLVLDGIGRNYCVTVKIKPEHKVEITKNIMVKIGDLEITPFEVPHDSSDCVGYRVEHQGVTFCLITDVGRVTPVIEEQIALSNYLVIESNHDEDMLAMGPYPSYLKGRIRSGRGHLSNKECAEALAHFATPELHHVWLCHLSEENNHPELARKTHDAVLRSYGLIPGVDFQIDILKRKVPSGFYDLI